LTRQELVCQKLYEHILLTGLRQGVPMGFDWITWSIWTLGLIILIVWIYVPTMEFMQLLKDRKKSAQKKLNSPDGPN
jgi:hypothetical protein